MNFDEYGSAYISSDDLCNLLYKNPDLQIEHFLVEDPELYNDSISKFYLDLVPLKKYLKLTDISIEEFDDKNINNWYMPDEYKNLDIAEYIVNLCTSEIELDRVATELFLFQERNLFDLLRFLKYMVDTFKKNNIVYGIGRGSSTSSYVLYLLGVHKVDSIEYDLDIKEFLK
jgi:DNA polymerase III alpha subunit